VLGKFYGGGATTDRRCDPVCENLIEIVPFDDPLCPRRSFVHPPSRCAPTRIISRRGGTHWRSCRVWRRRWRSWRVTGRYWAYFLKTDPRRQGHRAGRAL